jgi:hypothetical protein
LLVIHGSDSFLDLIVGPAVAMPQAAARLPRLAEHVRIFVFERVEVMLTGDLLNQAFRGIESKLFAHGFSFF